MLADPRAVKHAAFTDALLTQLFDPRQLHYGQVQRAICKAAAAVYRNGERTDSPLYPAFLKLANTDPWRPEFDTVFVVPCLRVFGRTELALEKSAFITPLKKVIGLAPAMTRTGVASALTLGGTGGVLYWLLNRDIQGDRSDTVTLRERARLYRQLSQQLDEELAEVRDGRPQPDDEERRRITAITGAKQIS